MTPGAIRAAITVLAALAVAASAGTARADRPRIIVLDTGESALAGRMRAELITMGFDASVVAVIGATSNDLDIDTVTRQHEAVAAIRLVSAPGRTQALLFDRTTGKTLTRWVVGDPTQERPLALRVVELLRASLLELGLPDAPRGEIAASPTLLEAAHVPVPATVSAMGVPTASPQRPLVAIAVGPGITGSAGGLGPAAAIALSAGALLGPTIRVGALALLPLSAMKHQATEGSSETRVTILGADIRRQVLGQTWYTSWGAGAALTILSTDGRGNRPLYRDSQGTRLGWGGYLRAGAGYEITTAATVSLDVLSGVQAHPFAIDYAGREAGRWGMPWFAACVVVELRLP